MTIPFKTLSSAFIYSEDLNSFLDRKTGRYYFGAVWANWIACFFYAVFLTMTMLTLCYISISDSLFIVLISVAFTCLAVALIVSFISCFIFQKKIYKRMDAELQRRNVGHQRIAIITLQPLCSNSESPAKPHRAPRHNSIYLAQSNNVAQYSVARFPQSLAAYESVVNPIYSSLEYERT